MKSLPSLDSALLAQLQRSVAQLLGEVTAREQALAADTPSLLESGWRQKLRACGQRAAQLDTQAHRAAETLRDADGMLADSEQELRQHLTAMADLRQKLTDWASRAIG